MIRQLMFVGLVVLTLGCSGEGSAAAPPGKPELPLTVEFRTAMLGSGLVAKFKNTSSRNLGIKATFENKTFAEAKVDRLLLRPFETVERGWAEGWQFMSGESITLEHEDYSPKTLKVP